VTAARVLPDVAGFDRELDYEVPAGMVDDLRPGCLVRAPLQGRKVRGWVTAFPVEPPPGVHLRPIEKALGWGPEAELLPLATWAAWRWAGRRRSLLFTASAERLVGQLPPPARRRVPRPPPGASPGRQLLLQAWRPVTAVLRLPPAASATELVLAAAEHGPVLVIAPTVARAEAGCSVLRRRGLGVALLPGDWAQARAGADIVIGARGAAWGPCPGLTSVVVLDAHDEGLVQQQAPTWSAPWVAAERARRAGAPCFWVTACPTLELLAGAAEAHAPSRADERQGWAPLRVADRRGQDPREGLYSREVVNLARTEPRRVVFVLNRKGRATLLDCAACRELATCERCASAVSMGEEGLRCRRCGERRPVVCSRCGSDALRAVRAGVSRARDHLEALAGREVGEVTARSGALPEAPLLVGTEAVLYREEELRRGAPVGAVAFLDFDQELMAPRYRAGEEALALLARAARLVGGRRNGGQVLVQTRVPDHPVIAAALNADGGMLAEVERPVRESLRLPPFGALAVLSGEGAARLASSVGQLARPGAPVEASAAGEERWVLRAPSHDVLADVLAEAARPGERVRVEVGPARI
jgi:primosomal protein N' (replication factor Y)